jgi:hypothetical protein
MPKKRSQQNDAGEMAQNEGPVDAARVTLPLTLSVLFILALVAAAAFLPHAQLWGINHLIFYPVPVRVIALALIGVTFIPAVGRRLYAAMLGLSRTIKQGGQRVDLALTVIAILSVILFWTFRASTNLLGDGQLIAQSYEAAWEGNDRVIMRSTKAIVTEERIAPGATLMYYGAAKAVSGAFGKGPVWGIKLFVSWLGALLVYLLLNVLRKGPFSSEVRLWMLALAVFSSTMELFFGYIEFYAPLVFLAFLYVSVGFLVIHEGSKPWAVAVLFLLTVYTHIQAVLLGPSLLFLILWRTMKQRRRLVERYAGPALTVLVVVVAIAAGFTRIGKYYLPLRGDGGSYGLFSPIHIADALNEIMILMPILPLFIVMAWVNRSLTRNTDGRRGKPDAPDGATGWFAMTAEWHFVLLMLVPCFLYLFLFKPEIGMARDWDLFTMTTLGLVPLALLIVNRFFRATKMQLTAASFTAPAIAIYVVLAIAWVGINSSSARSTARFERILEYDKTHASYAYENLAIYYHDNGMLDKATEIMETACDISRNPRQYVRLAMYYEEQGRREDAYALMWSNLKKHPENHKVRAYLLSLLEADKRWEEAWEVARDGTKYHPEESLYWFFYGDISIEKGMVDVGLSALRKCLTLGPPVTVRERCLERIKAFSGNNR